MSDPTIDDGTDGPDDPSQLILPHMESGIRIGKYRARNLAYSIPGLGIGTAGGTSMAFGVDPLVGGATLAAGGVVAGSGFALAQSAGEHSTGLDKLRGPIRGRRQRREMPADRDDLLGDESVHGVERVSSEGFVEMEDGRLLAFIRLHGRNTDLTTDEERQRMASSLSGRANDRLGDYGFRYFSTTVAFDDDLAERFRSVAHPNTEGYRGGEWATARAVLRDVAEWHEGEEAERWDARRWCHYAVVEVTERDVTKPRGGESRLAPFLEPIPRLGHSVSDTDRERTVARQTRELRKRVATLGGEVIGPTPGVEVEQAGGGEVAALLARYWSGTAGGFDRDHPADPTDERALARALSADRYDPTGDYVQVGRQYARTYWIAGWPNYPDAALLRELTTLSGVDVDVTVRVEPTTRADAKYKLKQKATEVGIDVAEREEESDLSALADAGGMNDYRRAYLLLAAGATRAWTVNGYVTVRAGTREALDSAEEALADRVVDQDDVSLDVERARALEERAENVRTTAEEPPAELTLVSPAARSRDLFESGSPVGHDVYRRTSSHDRDRIALGGVIGALFPAVSAVYDHADGIGWGRNRQNRSEILADPFNVGGPAHGLFIGDSGSGKTYSVVLRALRWWLAAPDRTLVLAGPFGDLSGLVEAFGGNRLVVGGSQTINPLDVSPGDGADGVDAVKAKVREVTAFVAGVLRENGVEPGDYTTTIRNAAFRTFEEAGIRPDEPETHARPSPTMEDYRDELADMAERPGEEAHSTSGAEEGIVENTAARLLHELSGFQEGREYEHFAGENQFDVEEGGLSYIDISQLESLGDAGRSVALQTVLSRIYERVKTAEETLFLLDEAHYLLQNEETLEWIQRATRHWRHHNGGLWLASQRARDFVDPDDGSGDGHLETVRTQCTIKQLTDLDGVTDLVAERFDLNPRHVGFLDERAMRGDAFKKTDQQGYSDALLSFKDMKGWVRTQVRASPLEHALLTHEPGEDPPIDEYLTNRGFGHAVAPSAD